MFLLSQLLRIILVIFILCATATSFSQKLSDATVENLVKRARENTNNSDSLKTIGTQTLAYATKNNLVLGQMEAHFMLGYAAYLKGKFKEAILAFDKGIDKAPQDPTTYPTAYRLLKNKAISYVRLGKPDSAQVIFKEVVDLTKERKDAKNHALALNDYAIGIKNKGDYSKALEVYARTMELWDSLGVDKYKTSLLLNIGLAQNNLKQTDRSIQTYHEGLTLAKKYKVDRDIYRFYNNLSVNYNIKEQHDSSLYYSRKTADYYRKNNSGAAEALAYQNMGKAFMGLEQKDSASYYYAKAEKSYKSTDAKARLGELYYLRSINNRKKENYTAALHYSDSAINIFKELTLVANLKDTYDQKALILEATGDFKEANSYIKAAKKIEDESYKTENVEKLNEIITKYQVEKKDDQIDALHSQKAIYKSTSFIVGVASLVLLSIVIVFWVRNKNSKKELETLREELKNYKETAVAENALTLIHLKSKAVLNTKELLYIKSDGHYLEFYSQGSAKPEIDRNTLKEMTERLTSEGFAQIHKSYLVNLDYIRIINSTKLMLDDGTWLPLSRTYKPKLKETLLHTAAT
ncbi:LytTR family transcriptional regulator DNA-binding domain-containing protein [Rasiella sp. SM2506]|uniref:LytTR family transcriptional regulator DNA-binding domain-containing protein n=1 Tax=Rasiella sp. SM2506 TaxID=3423914 RepID=UPI003D7B3BD7